MKIKEICLIVNIILFILITIFLFSIYKKDKMKRLTIKLPYSIVTIIVLIICCVIITYFLANISFSRNTNLIIFILLVSLVPFVLSSNLKRKNDEAIFKDVILYCSSTIMLVKQNHNVYGSIEKVKDDLKTSLSKDLCVLLESLSEGKNETILVMQELEKKYNYSCLKNLDVIILYMFFENNNIDEVLLDTFSDDVERLNKDVLNNQKRRKTLRFQYIMISISSLFTFWFLYQQVKSSLNEDLLTTSFKIINAVYLVLSIICLFSVDLFFNNHITRE